MKMFKLSLLAVVILSSVHTGGLAQCESVQPTGQNQLPPKVRNIGYLGTGYNIFKGNPHSTFELDPGLTIQSVYALLYDSARTTPDGCHSIPDHTNVESASVCTFEFTSNSVRNIASYFLSLKMDVEANFGAYGASFSASTDYNVVLENTAAQESRFVKSHAVCEDYLAVLQPGAELDEGFKTAVKNLDHNSDLDGYLEFIQQYGTHYLAGLTMGGRFGFQSEFETNSYMNMLSIGLDVKVAAGYSGEIDIEASTATDIQIQMASEFNRNRKAYKIYQVGGTPPSDASGKAFAWAQTVKDDPLPIRYQLREIAELFTRWNFENDSNIDIKRSKLRNATLYYCERNLSLSFCRSAGPTSEGSIRIVPTMHVKHIDLLNAPWFYQTVDSPSFAVMGMFVTQTSPNYIINDSYAVVDAQNSSPNLITTASSWTFVDKYFLRPNCTKNFSRLSDFVAPDQGTCDENDITNCLHYLPQILPCVANHCLRQCSSQPAEWVPLVYSAYYITNGFKVFGNGNANDDLRFFTIQDQNFSMCLASECVDDF